MSEKEVQDYLFNIRTWYFSTLGVKIPLSKRLNIDLLAKFCILCFNSIGKELINEIVFLDEVANKNMSDNLRVTIDHCKKPYSIMTFYKKEAEYPHIKIGYRMPILFIIDTLIKTIGNYILIPVRGIEKTRRITSDSLERSFIRYLRSIYGKTKSIYCMTDHNYFSTIACVNKRFYSSVIQHGLWLSDEIGEQVLADRICVWGERSEQVIKTNKTKDITGTFKFEKLLESADLELTSSDKVATGNTILFCISSLDQNTVIDKVQVVLDKTKKYGYVLKVKTHPGFGFPVENLKKKFPNIEFYKECTLTDIPFTIGICENSTVLLDIMCLGRKYIIFDIDTTYFGVYENMIPWAKDPEDLDTILANIEGYDYSEVTRTIIRNELNDNVCTLFERG